MMEPQPSRFSARSPIVWAAFLVLAAGALVRGWRIAADPMWLDEAYSAYAASKGWHFLWTIVPRYETHPPFYYSLVRAWTLLAGDSLLAHRSLGLACGIVAIPVIAAATRIAATTIGLTVARANLAALATLALAASAPILIQMTHEVRPYPVMILVYALAILALLLVARRVADGGPLIGRAYVGYLTATALMLWLHSLGPLYGLALGLALLLLVIRRSLTRADWLWLIGGHILVGLVYLPALLILFDQAPTWIRSTWLAFDTRQLWRRATAIYCGPRDDMRLAALVLTIGAIIGCWRSLIGRRIALALLVLATVPILCSILISATITPVFIVRTMTPIAVPALILFGLGAVAVAGMARWTMIAAFIWLAVQQSAGAYATTQSGPMQDWYGALDWLAPQFRPGDVVFAYPNEGALPFDRAVFDRGQAMPSRAIPTEIPSLNPPPGSWYVSGSRGVPSLDAAHLHAIAIDPRTRAVPTIWLLRLGPWAYDKGDVLLKELSVGRVEVDSYSDGPIDIVGLRKK